MGKLGESYYSEIKWLTKATAVSHSSRNGLDLWLLSRTRNLITTMITARTEMEITAALSRDVRFCLRSISAGGGPKTAAMGVLMRFSII